MTTRLNRLRQAVSVLVVLATWHLLTAVTGVISTAALPAPAGISRRTVELLGESSFRAHISATAWRTLLASLIAVPAGVGVGFAMGLNERVKAVVAPVLYALYPMPSIALLPLLLLVIDSKSWTIIFLGAVGGFFVLVWNAMTAVEEINSVYFDVARDNGVESRYALFRELLLPGALSGLFTGIRLCLSTALLIIISVEFITADQGLGYFVWRAWGLYELSDMYGAVIVIGALGVVITYGIGQLQRRLLPWQTDTDDREFTSRR